MKVASIITGVLMICGALYCVSCDNDGEKDTTSQLLPLLLLGDRYAIGDTGPSGVGIVFYISDGGKHGLEAAPALWDGDPNIDSQDPFVDWSNVTSTAIGTAAQGVAIGTGLANSNTIIAQEGHTTSAALLCRNYTGGGLTDWYLPATDEFIALGQELDTVGGFINERYWTSHENGADLAEAYDVLTGGRGGHGKDMSARVRPIRSF